MTDQPPDWAVSVPSTDLIHQRPVQEVTRPFEQQSLLEIGLQLIEQFLSQVVEALVGVFIPGGLGSAFEQLRDWADDLGDMVAEIPVFGPIIELLADLFGIDIGDPGAPDLSDIWLSIPIIGDILRMLGIGAPNDDGESGTPGTGGFDLWAAIQNFINGLLVPGGVVTNETPIPPNLLAALSPGASPNILPATATAQMIDGKGQWVWDWPGEAGGNWGSPGVVRTVRPGLITIFWVTGTWQGGASGTLPSPFPDPMTELRNVMSDQYVPPGSLLPLPGDNVVDWERFEVIAVKYPGALYPMGYSVNEGVRELKSLINQIPGKFIILSGSQGGAVASRVYDEIRKPAGSLHHRDDDFLFGFCFGNMMREEGTGFPDPEGNQVVYCTEGHGILEPTLTGTVGDERWWEWSVPAGTYPAYGNLEGITWPHSDPISCLGHDANADEVRLVLNETMKATTLNASAGTDFMLAMLGNIIWHPNAMNTILNIAFNVNASSHGNSVWQVQPFLADGDERSMWRYVWDHINDTFGPLVSPPTIGVRHQMEGTQRQPVQPRQIVRASVPIGWMNVLANGPAFTLGINVYDAAGKLLPGVSPTVTAEQATISDPQPESSGWVPLSASFVMPEGAKTACITLDVSAEAMTTGIVWWDIGNATYEITTGLFDASKIDNIENIPQIPSTNVSGVQGQANMYTSLQNLIEGTVAAHQQGPATEAELAEFFASQGATAISAAQALTLAIAHEQQLALVTNKPIYVGLEPTGEATFPLDSLPQGEIMPSTEIPMGETLMGFITSQSLADKGFVEFMAEANSATGVYLNVYLLDPDTGEFTQLWASGDISGSIPDGTFGWVGVNIPLEEEFSVPIGHMFACEIVAEGSAVNVVTKTTGMPNKATTVPPNFGASRTISVEGRSPLTLEDSDFTYSSTHPYILFGVSNLPATYEPPNQNIFKGAGVEVMPIPAWAQTAGVMFDTVLLGAGASGGPSTFFIFPGVGGHGGTWEADTLTYGDEIPLGTQELIIFKGQGGLAATQPQPGGATKLGYASSVPMFDKAGSGSSIVNGTVLSWQHNSTAAAYVVVWFSTAPGSTVSSVTYGGESMTLLGDTATPDVVLRAYGLADVAGGNATVTVTFASATSAAGGSESYTGIGNVLTPAEYTGLAPGTTPAVDCDPGQIIVCGFASGGTSASMTGGTTRYRGAPTGGNLSLVIGESNVPTAFAVNYVGTGFWWTGMTLIMEAAERETLLTADGGAINAPGQAGLGVDDTSYQGRRYFGGRDSMAAGLAPGGGGAGGGQFAATGYPGAPGQVWITMRQP